MHIHYAHSLCTYTHTLHTYLLLVEGPHADVADDLDQQRVALVG